MNQAEDPTPSHNPMHRVLGNFWILIRGRGAAAIMAFGATALMARALGPAEFGLVILIHTYVMLIRALLDYGSMDAIVKYGVPALDSGDNLALGKLIKVCRRLDKQACITATLLALLAAPFAGPIMGMDKQGVIILMAYSTILLTASIGSATGILRLYNKYDIIGRHLTIGPLIRFFGVIVAWWFSAPIEVFVGIWGLAYVTENFYLLWQANHKYQRNIKHALSMNDLKSASLNDFNGLRHFLWVTYWQSNLDILPKHITTLLIGYLLGPVEAGLLRLANELSSALAKPAALIRQVVFADLTRSWNQANSAFNIIAYRTAILGGGLGSAFVLISYFFGEYLLHALLGNQYIAAKEILTLMLLAATLDLTASPLRSALYAMGKAFNALRLHILSTAIYIVLFVVLTKNFGLIGAGLAASSSAGITLSGMYLLFANNKRGN